MGTLCFKPKGTDVKGKGATTTAEAQAWGTVTPTPTPTSANSEAKKLDSGAPTGENLQQGPMTVKTSQVAVQPPPNNRGAQEFKQESSGTPHSIGSLTLPVGGGETTGITPSGSMLTGDMSAVSMQVMSMGIGHQSSISTKQDLSCEASESLREFAKRNRPKRNPDKFKTCAGVTGDHQTMLEIAKKAAIPSISETEVDETQLPATSVDGDQLADLDEKTLKYDIFDEIDAERLKEFDEIFNRVKDSSNYEAHKKKSKRIDPNKFSTLSGVTTDEQTGMSMLT